MQLTGQLEKADVENAKLSAQVGRGAFDPTKTKVRPVYQCKTDNCFRKYALSLLLLGCSHGTEPSFDDGEGAR